MRRTLTLVGASLGCASLAFGVEPETISLEYSAPASCPPQAVFAGEVSARTELARFSNESPSRRFRVVIEAREAGFVGRLEILGKGDERTLREIEGEACKDVVSVLALTAALAVDPHASTKPSSELVMKPEQPAPASSAEVTPTPAAAKPTVEPSPVVPAPGPTPVRQASRPIRVAVGAGAHVTSGPAPKLLIGPLLFGEIEWRDAASLWSPLFRLGARAARTGILGPAFDEAEFGWLVAKSELCPIRLGLSDAAELRPCAFADLGVETAQGRTDAVDVPRSKTRFWSSIGLSGWLRIELGGGFFGCAGAGLETPLTRLDFVFQRPARDVVYEVPALAGHGEIVLGYDLK